MSNRYTRKQLEDDAADVELTVEVTNNGGSKGSVYRLTTPDDVLVAEIHGIVSVRGFIRGVLAGMAMAVKSANRGNDGQVRVHRACCRAPAFMPVQL